MASSPVLGSPVLGSVFPEAPRFSKSSGALLTIEHCANAEKLGNKIHTKHSPNYKASAKQTTPDLGPRTLSTAGSRQAPASDNRRVRRGSTSASSATASTWATATVGSWATAPPNSRGCWPGPWTAGLWRVRPAGLACPLGQIRAPARRPLQLPLRVLFWGSGRGLAVKQPPCVPCARPP